MTFYHRKLHEKIQGLNLKCLAFSTSSKLVQNSDFNFEFPIKNPSFRVAHWKSVDGKVLRELESASNVTTETVKQHEILLSSSLTIGPAANDAVPFNETHHSSSKCGYKSPGTSSQSHQQYLVANPPFLFSRQIPLTNPCSYRKSAMCNMQHAICNVQHTTCNVQLFCGPHHP